MYSITTYLLTYLLTYSLKALASNLIGLVEGDQLSNYDSEIEFWSNQVVFKRTYNTIKTALAEQK